MIIGVPVAKAAADAQIPWLEAIEIRLAATAKSLGSTKAIKMTGLADIVSSRITNLRLDEIRASLRHRVYSILVFVAGERSQVIPLTRNEKTANVETSQHLLLLNWLRSGASPHSSCWQRKIIQEH